MRKIWLSVVFCIASLFCIKAQQSVSNVWVADLGKGR